MKKTIINFFENLPEWAFLCIYLGFILIHDLVLGLQGIGMEDEGWCLTAYQQIFSHPQSVSYNFLYYNGILVGGLWNLLLGQYGIISFRILAALFDIACALMVYLTLRKFIWRWSIAIGYTIIIVMSVWIGSFNHNSLTFFLCLVAIFLILKALTTEKRYLMILAGVMIGINVFTRIPNLAEVLLIFVLVSFYYDTKNAQLSIKLLCYAIIGFLLGVSLELILMYILGHLTIFTNNIFSGLSAASDGDSTHNLFTMLSMWIMQYFKMLLLVGVVFILPGIRQFFQNTYSRNQRILYIVMLLQGILIYYLLDYYEFTPKNFIYAIFIITTLIYARNFPILKHIPQYHFIIAGLMALVIPLGSDWGYDSGITLGASTLMMPLSVEICYNSLKQYRKKVHSFEYDTSIAICLVLCIISLNCTYRKSLTCGEESGSRLKKTYLLDSPLATVYTSQKVYDKLNPLLYELSKYVKQDDKVLCFQSLAMVHYLTHTQPYLENAWPWTYTSADMERHFLKAQNESDVLPIIVREKGWVMDIFNEGNYPDWDNSEAVENRYHKNKKIKLIQDFIHENNYSVVWEDKAFQILVPPSLER